MEGIVLTSAQITEKLSGTRVKGAHEAFLRRFNASGEMYWDVRVAPEYKGKPVDKLDSLKVTLTQKIAKLGEEFNHLRMVKVDDENLIVLNMALYGESQEDEAVEQDA